MIRQGANLEVQLIWLQHGPPPVLRNRAPLRRSTFSQFYILNIKLTIINMRQTETKALNLQLRSLLLRYYHHHHHHNKNHQRNRISVMSLGRTDKDLPACDHSLTLGHGRQVVFRDLGMIKAQSGTRGRFSSVRNELSVAQFLR